MAHSLTGPWIVILAMSGSLVAQEPSSKPDSRPAEKKSSPLKAPAESKDDSAPTSPSASPTAAPIGAPLPQPDLGRSSGAKWWITPEKFKEFEERYQKVQERLLQLERQLKGEKNLPSACKLVARIEGDTLVGRADILFATPDSPTTLFLGLKNAFLIDEGRLDDSVPHLEASEEGYAVRVRHEGEHHLVLNYRVPLTIKRSAGATVTNERGFELGLPGAAVTTLNLSLGPNVKSIRWNDVSATPKAPGQWDLTLGAQKSIQVTWKEPVAAPAQGLGIKAHADIKVKLDDSRLEISGQMILEDIRGQAREWQLLLPAQARVWPATGSPAFTWVAPTEGKGLHILRLSDPADKVTLLLEASYPRSQPQQKVPIGPFLVQGARTQGTIQIQATADALRGQRLIYHRFGEISSRDAKGDIVAQFQFNNATFGGKGLSPAKAPLELEWKTEMGQIDATTEHEVKIRDRKGGWEVDVESRFLLQSTNSGLDVIEFHPRTGRFVDFLWFVPQPGLAFPAAVRWPSSLASGVALPLKQVFMADNQVLDAPQTDAQMRLRLKLGRPIGSKIAVTTTTQMLLFGDTHRFRLELPRLVNVLDRGGKITVHAPPGQEFLVDAHGVEEPVADKYVQSLEQMTSSLDLSWRPKPPLRLAQAEVDIFLQEHGTHVRQRLSLPVSQWGRTQPEQLSLQLPEGTEISFPASLAVLQRGDRLWMPYPSEVDGKFNLEIPFDLPSAIRKDAEGKSAVAIPLLWPEGTTNRDVKVRIWTEPNLAPSLVPGVQRWRRLGIEKVEGQKAWPALVAAASGPDVTLEIAVAATGGQGLPSFTAEHTLLQAQIAEDGSQTMRLRFLVRRFTTTSLELELPVPLDQAQAEIRIAGMKVSGAAVVDPVRNRLRVPLAPDQYPQPVLFEVDYQVPASFVDGKRLWQTPLALPRFAGEARFGKTRWLVSLPAGQTPFILGSSGVDYRWSLDGYLISPSPTLTSRDLDAWVGAPEPEDRPVSLTWVGAYDEDQRIHHFTRQFWLVLCSGLFLVMGLTLILLPLPRWALGLILLGLAAGFVALGMFHEYLLVVLFFGSQPALVVLTLVAVLQWLLQERYRRQLVFMPTFARIPQGSTVVRGKKPREASTVDAPPGLTSPQRG